MTDTSEAHRLPFIYYPIMGLIVAIAIFLFGLGAVAVGSTAQHAGVFSDYDWNFGFAVLCEMIYIGVVAGTVAGVVRWLDD